MPLGSFDLDNTVPSLSGPAATIVVCRYTPTASPILSLLPNVQCLRIDAHQGSRPTVARFRYIQDDSLQATFAWPSQFENLWPVDAQGPYVVLADDRVVVLIGNPDGTYEVLFDGFAQIPEVELSERTQRVSFTAIGVAIRAWDMPIRGRWQRSASNPQADGPNGPIRTDLPTRFNPADTFASNGNKSGFIPNCTPDGYNVDSSNSDASYPVFLEQGLERTPDPRTYWTVSKAIRYLLANYNDQIYVTNPSFEPLDEMLDAMYPFPGYSTLDPQGSAGYQSAGITLRDYDATDKAWPDALEELLGYAGFSMSFATATDDEGLPINTLNIYRTDSADPVAPKFAYLAPSRTDVLDPSANNITRLNLNRDLNSLVNCFSIESPLKQVEVSVILSPGFEPMFGDQMAANRRQFVKSQLVGASATIRRKYRWYVVDECGDGHWVNASQSWSVTPFDFSSIFPISANGIESYVQRYRPGAGTLLSVDSDGHPLQADLSISFNYAGAIPGIWDGTGTWESINGGWSLLKDRLGITVEVEDPENWNGGKTVGDIRAITWQANPPSGTPTNGSPFVLRLTTVLSDDRMLHAVADKRVASPTQFTRRRRADARDHFQYNRVVGPSLNNAGSQDVITRDDTNLALAHAMQLRASHEFPPLVGSMRLPYISTFYGIGDRIASVVGRDVSFQTNIGSNQGEAPQYPSIVGLSWLLEDSRQETVIRMSDNRSRADAWSVERM